jgi:sepiapterin reductase
VARKRLFIVTGASRGLGYALAEQLLAADVIVLTLARHPNENLVGAASSRGAALEQWAVDLGRDHTAAERLEVWLRGLDATGFSSATLINNAGLVGSVGPIEASDAATLAAVMRVNLEAPLILIGAFLRATRSWAIDKCVLNISSGVGQRAVAGWAAYCATKAGLDHLSRVIALDEALLPNPARIVSLAPGVIDTDMQGELRGADATGFPEKQNFVELKASGKLPSPAAAAQRVLAYLARSDFGSQPVADVRNV